MKHKLSDILKRQVAVRLSIMQLSVKQSQLSGKLRSNVDQEGISINKCSTHPNISKHIQTNCCKDACRRFPIANSKQSHDADPKSLVTDGDRRFQARTGLPLVQQTTTTAILAEDPNGMMQME